MNTRERLELREKIDCVRDLLWEVSTSVLNEEYSKAKNIHKAVMKKSGEISDALDQELSQIRNKYDYRNRKRTT